MFTMEDFRLFCALENQLPNLVNKFGICLFNSLHDLALVHLAGLSLPEDGAWPKKFFRVAHQLHQAILKAMTDLKLNKRVIEIGHSPMFKDEDSGLEKLLYGGIHKMLYGAREENRLLNTSLCGLRGPEFLNRYRVRLENGGVHQIA